LLPLAALHVGCIPDYVAPGYVGDMAGDDAGSVGATSADATTVLAEAPASPAAAPPEADADAPDASGPAAPCDLSGRWLVTRREVATAVGSVEAAHSWYYYELAQTGSAIAVTKGLHCGEDVRGVSAVAANVDYPKTWPAMMAKETDTGRTGTSAEAASGCSVSFAKHYDVAGATVSFFSNPGEALPSASQQGSTGMPGWEDWDGDGKPGFTMNVSGLVTGQVYMATRSWSEWTGSVALRSSSFTLQVDWAAEQDVLGINGPSLLSQAASGVKDSDPTQHFAVFARLGAGEATGDDDAICTAVRSLAATRTPSASN
jgi:hypothetical protein